MNRSTLAFWLPTVVRFGDGVWFFKVRQRQNNCRQPGRENVCRAAQTVAAPFFLRKQRSRVRELA